MDLLSGAVAKITEAPPRVVSSFATSMALVSRYRTAPSFTARVYLS